MPLFKKKLPANTLAVLLMQYTITGDAFAEDGGRFALGPHGISTEDGSHVLPENSVRTNKNHLSRRDSIFIELETMYLRGFVVFMLLNSFIKNNRVREAVFNTYNDFWRTWTTKESLNYQDFFEKDRQIYGARLLVGELEQKTRGQNLGEVSQIAKEIGVQFSSLCDPLNIIKDPLQSELAELGESIFINACKTIHSVLETVTQKHRVTAS
jgi:hypothetical protein